MATSLSHRLPGISPPRWFRRQSQNHTLFPLHHGKFLEGRYLWRGDLPSLSHLRSQSSGSWWPFASPRIAVSHSCSVAGPLSPPVPARGQPGSTPGRGKCGVTNCSSSASGGQSYGSLLPLTRRLSISPMTSVLRSLVSHQLPGNPHSLGLDSSAQKLGSGTAVGGDPGGHYYRRVLLEGHWE
uniref:Uncharacterized protein n=1 Tax=Molossus molossus TaxID=27622 RepID=A0A7J8CZ91_MOLMO|nr:hypothetical protein HJG59_009547 [Molossus molossus]